MAKQNHIRLYEPCPKEHFDVIPIDNILGKVSLMPDVSDPTIPSRVKGKSGFPLGRTGPNGSRLWYVNHYAMIWSRSKKSLYR